ncbi:hypothetical protein V8E51_004169 [Hyaloscypha variabilis]
MYREADEEDATVWTVVGTTLNIAPILVVLAGGQTAPPETEVEDANTDETTTLEEEDPRPSNNKVNTTLIRLINRRCIPIILHNTGSSRCTSITQIRKNGN